MLRILQSKLHLHVEDCVRNSRTSASEELIGSCKSHEHRRFVLKELLLVHAKQEKSKLVLEIYGQLNSLDFNPNGHIFVSVIKACASEGAYKPGKLIHSQVIERGFESNVFVASSLINFYFKSGSLEDGQEVFDGLQRQDIVIWNAMIAGYAQHGHVKKMLNLFKHLQRNGLKPNIASWNAMIGGLTHNKLNEEALQLFNQMMQEGCLPEDVTFASVLNACANMAAQNQGKFLHVHLLEEGLSSDIFLGNTLINLYVKCENFQQAHAVFDRLPQQDCVTWNALISGHSLHGNCAEALELFHDMQKRGHDPDLVTWNALLTGHVLHGHVEEALHLFQSMDEQGRKPDSVTLVSVLKACSSVASLKKGKLFHAYMLETGAIKDLFLCNALIDMYAKCGSLEDAYGVFMVLPKRDSVTWNSIIAANSLHNQYKAAFECFENMQSEGFQPDDVTFLCILSACSRGGSIGPGPPQSISTLSLDSIVQTPEQYGTIADMLGREGFLQEAGCMLGLASIKGDLQACLSLLSHCRTYGNLHIGKRCFDHICLLDDQYTSCYELMPPFYADTEMWENVGHIEDL